MNRRGDISGAWFTELVDQWIDTEDEKAFHGVYIAVLPLIEKRANRFPNTVREDVISAGLEGLVKGINRYKAEGRSSAQPTILWEIADEMTREFQIHRSPVYVPYGAYLRDHQNRPMDDDSYRKSYELALEEALYEIPDVPQEDDNLKLVELYTDLERLLNEEEFSALLLAADGWGVREIATELGVSSATAHRRLSSAREKASEYLLS